ncbi:MAG: nucleotidyltransferase family protein, partial [Acidobacteriota bacterium]
LVHLAHHYFSPRLIWVNDIQEMTTRSSLDWDRILARAERWKLRIPVHYSINYVEKIFPEILPARVLEGGEVGWFRRLILKAVGTANPMALTVPMRDPVLRLPFSLYFIDRPTDMAKFLWRNLGPKLGVVTRVS